MAPSPIRFAALALLVSVGLGCTARPLTAQAAGSTYVLAAGRLTNAAVAHDTQFSLAAHLGSFEPGSTTAGSGLTLTGGLVAVIDPPVTGAGAVPWPLAVQPPFVDVAADVANPVVLRGAALDTDGALSARVGNAPATVLSVTKPAVTIAIAPPLQPGYQPVHLTGQNHATAVVPGLGVLPLLGLEEPAAPDRPLGLLCHGHPGDRVWIAVSAGAASVGVRVPPFHHHLLLAPSSFVLVGAFSITASDGRLRLVLPPPGVTSPVVIQGLVIVGGSASYAPGSFTNVVRL
jgi:hypothetical protein